MDDQELNRAVAEKVFDWRHQDTHWWRTSWPDAANTVTIADIPNFAGDIVAAMSVEDRIAELGDAVKYAYVTALSSQPTTKAFRDPFDVIHATPRERCLAALKAVEG